MQQVNSATAEAVRQYQRISLRVEIEGHGAVDPAAVSYTAGINGADTMSIGGAASASMALTGRGSLPDLRGRGAAIYWSTAAGGEYPWIIGTVTEQVEQDDQTVITVRDAMYTAGQYTYEPDISVQSQCTALAALNDIAAQMGVESDLDTAEYAAGIQLSGLGVAPLWGLTCMDAAGHLAAVLGGNAIITRSGKLAIKRFTRTEFASESYSGADSADSNDFSVSGVIFYTATVDGAEIEYTAGTAPNWLRVASPIANTSLAEIALAALDGVSVRAGAAEFPGGIMLEPGDIMTSVTRSGSRLLCASQITVDWDGGTRTSVISSGGEIYTAGAKGQISREVKRLVGKTYELTKDINGVKLSLSETRESVAGLERTATDLEITSANISAQVTATQEVVGRTENRMTAVEQTAEQFSVRVQNIIDDGVSKVTTSTGVAVDDAGLHVNRSGEEMESIINFKGLQVKRDETIILQANADGVKSDDITVRRYLVVGTHTRIEDYTDPQYGAGTGLFYIGGD